MAEGPLKANEMSDWSLVRRGTSPNLVRFWDAISKVRHSQRCNISLFLTLSLTLSLILGLYGLVPSRTSEPSRLGHSPLRRCYLLRQSVPDMRSINHESPRLYMILLIHDIMYDITQTSMKLTSFAFNTPW